MELFEQEHTKNPKGLLVVKLSMGTGLWRILK